MLGPNLCAILISVMGSVMGHFPLSNGVLLVIAKGKVHWPMRKNSGNGNDVCRSLGAEQIVYYLNLHLSSS